MADTDREGITYHKDTEVGIMIETPAAVMIADALAREADFFSVETNDLAQYILAYDRQPDEVRRAFAHHHLTVLRAVKQTAGAAHKAGIRVSVCGDVATNPELLGTFLDIGIDELSVPPASVLPLRSKLHDTTTKNCTLKKLGY